MDEAADAIDRQIQGEINVLNANNKDGVFDKQIEGLEETKKELIAAIKSGKNLWINTCGYFLVRA